MSFAKCFDVVSMVTEEAGKQFGLMWRVDKDKEKILKKNCEGIDALAKEFNGVSFEVDVNDITMNITVSLVCGEIIISEPSHRLYNILQHAKRFAIKQVESDNIQLDFVFPGIWSKV